MTTQTATREHPILFGGAMIRAILAGRKSVTRRPAKTFESLASSTGHFVPLSRGRSIETDDRAIPFCPYGRPGDRLWCKETWATMCCYDYLKPSELSVNCDPWYYRADGEKDQWDDCERWRSPRFMPRIVSRITLEITGVRIERLQEITEENAIAEGMHEFKGDGKSFGFGYDPKGTPGPMVSDTAIGAFALLWESLNAKRGFSWDNNPFVWVISFKRVMP